ncbi:hypothetical protein SAMN02745248_02420 [Hathewaya proteolytica DSM 3090]|uniref:Uncharacterized protein n=1 Tax=Hathewaya proteolytica DSM 3090 TaxID=1121331 RepID=A0A1M6S1B7_9CLOT|nr:hypothetical protein [Hathewaya proteolytica]SHK38490.1 hypothetical protein SAMN02745248_02420 [Hathewaya proteolytica DSM 3090]
MNVKKIYRKMKMIGTIIISIILIVMKLSFILSALIQLAEIGLCCVKRQKITDSFVINEKKNRIEQVIGKNMLIKVWKNDYYKNKYKLLEELKKVDFKKAISKNKKLIGKELNCETNLVIYKHVLEKQIGSKNIRVDEESKILTFQPIEKLLFMNGRVIWRNLFNVKFWRYIFRKETIKKYYFTIEES